MEALSAQITADRQSVAKINNSLITSLRGLPPWKVALAYFGLGLAGVGAVMLRALVDWGGFITGGVLLLQELRYTSVQQPRAH